MIYATHIDDLSLQRAKHKYLNHPGFFEGIVDAIQEFHIVDFIQFHTYREAIYHFFKTYSIEGFSINPKGEVVNVIYPFETNSDLELAFRLLINYLK